jgi:hypothetical protein
MLRAWLARGGLRSERAKAGGLPPPLIFGHVTAALGVAFLASGVRPLAWAAVALLMVAAGLGLRTVTLWAPIRPANRGSGGSPSSGTRQHQPILRDPKSPAI